MSHLTYAPPPFINNNGDQIVFVHFTRAKYRLEFDAETCVASAFSEIRFTATTPGLAAISINQPVKSACLNGEGVELHDQVSPNGQASFKILSKCVSPGTHVLTMTSEITAPGPYGDPVTWSPDTGHLDCVFNMSDLRRSDGGYLEAFLPSNHNFDHFRMSISAKIRNSSVIHSLFSNGIARRCDSEHWQVDYPAYFTSSCPWFHLGPADKYQSIQDEFSSLDGRSIPILIYTQSRRRADRLLQKFLWSTRVILDELESDFGPFPHGSVTVYATGKGKGGMEYAGATATGLKSLRHELNHSYFARSIIPANGDAGWIDEAIACWGDIGYLRSRHPPVRGANMGRRSEYMRTTSDEAYSVGRDFLAHLDYVLRERGGLKPFLLSYATRKRHQSVTTEEFQELVEDYYGASLEQLFTAYVYLGDYIESYPAPAFRRA